MCISCYNYKTNETKYKCSLCNRWYIKDKVNILDCNNDNAIDKEVYDTDCVICHECYEKE